MNEGTVETQVIQSKIYGEIQVLNEQVYEFTHGIVGLEHLTKFALLPYDNCQLFTLQSFTDDIGLLLIPASLTNYQMKFELNAETIDSLGIHKPEDIIVFYIVRIIDGAPYINQKAPILLAANSQKGCQYIVPNDAISVRVPLTLKGEA